jgi:uncharacterized membrane protein YhiD involved in acid resistance
MTTKVKGVLIVILVLAAFSAGYQVNEWVNKKKQLEALQEQVEADKDMRNRLFQISLDTQEAISNIRIENRTIYQKTEREILKEPVYTECFLTDEGLKLVNKARGFE